MTRTELIERLEAAGNMSSTVDGISEKRLFDGRIEFLLHGENGRLYHSVKPRGFVARGDCPRYTSSIDAAMSLVPEGWRWNLKPSDVSGWFTEVWTDGISDFEFASHAATPALAICIAALKAQGTDDE